MSKYSAYSCHIKQSVSHIIKKMKITAMNNQSHHREKKEIEKINKFINNHLDTCKDNKNMYTNII